jgi:hypothetical protein
MIKQKFSKFVDFNITSDWEKFGVLADGVIGREISKLRQWGSGKRVCEKRILSGTTDVVMVRTPEEISGIFRPQVRCSILSLSSNIPTCSACHRTQSRHAGSGTPMHVCGRYRHSIGDRIQVIVEVPFSLSGHGR